MGFRAKMTVESVTSTEYNDRVKFNAKYTNSPEDNSYAKATPSGSIELSIDNPALRGTIKPGQVYYVDFAPVGPPTPVN